MPKGLRTLRLAFVETHLTHFGGMVLLQRFCNKLRLRWLIQNHIKVPQRHADYLPSDLILALLYAIMAGLRRINKTEILQYNGAFLSLLGLSCFPDQTTLRRFLKRLTPRPSANWSPCTTNFELNCSLYPDGKPPSPSISIR